MTPTNLQREKKCPTCGKSCKSKAGLTTHMNMMHLELSPSQVAQAVRKSDAISYEEIYGKEQKTKTLTKDISCRWCGALVGEPCKIQMPVGYVGHPQDYRLGNDKTYFKQEAIHLCRAK